MKRRINTLTQARLLEILCYDKLTGQLTWKVNRGRAFKGHKAGSLGDNGYIYIGIDGGSYLAHVVIWLMVKGYIPEHDIDHKNRIKDDNKWDNLREATRQCNILNSTMQKNNTSGVTGVSMCKKSGKFCAFLILDRHQHNLGRFVSMLDATRARWRAEVENNFPNCNTTSSAYQYLKEHNAL